MNLCTIMPQITKKFKKERVNIMGNILAFSIIALVSLFNFWIRRK